MVGAEERVETRREDERGGRGERQVERCREVWHGVLSSPGEEVSLSALAAMS